MQESHSGGRLTSDGGVMLLAMAERRHGIDELLARIFRDRPDANHAFAGGHDPRPRRRDPTLSWLENAPRLKDGFRLDLWACRVLRAGAGVRQADEIRSRHKPVEAEDLRERLAQALRKGEADLHPVVCDDKNVD